MIRRRTAEGWEGVTVDEYKNEPGLWTDVSRQILFASAASPFETRYFEIGPGGHTTFERHDHEHCVVVIRGSGTVRLADEVLEIGGQDAVHVPGGTPHQFANPGVEPFGFLCVVGRDRDRPEALDPGDACEASNPL